MASGELRTSAARRWAAEVSRREPVLLARRLRFTQGSLMTVDGTLPPLHPLEAEVMEELWARSEATVGDVRTALNARGGKVRAYTKLLTVMTRLDAKGLLVRRRAGRLDVYAPALSRDAYLQARAE